jgi:hypothetical protein
MALNLYSSGTTDTLLAAKLDVAGGTMTGGLTLSASGIIFSDSTYLTTAPAGASLAADQLTAGVVTANPTAGPTASGDVLQYDGAALVWAPSGGGGGSYLPLAGGTMTGAIVFDGTSGQYISKGNFDTSRGGNYGISLVCSIGYEFNWQAGWLTTTEQGSVTPRPLYLDSLAGTTLRAWDSSTSTGTEISHTGFNIGNSSAYFINAAPDLLKVFESTNNLGVSIAHDSIAIQHIDTPDRTGYFTNEYIGFEDLSGTPHSSYIEHDVITVQDDTATTQMRSTGITLSTSGAITFGDSTTQTTAGIGDAPSDGLPYVRKDGAWDANTSPVGSVAWGAITGTVTDQTDLVSYVTGLGYQTAGDVSTYVTGLGYQTAGDVSTYVSSVGRRQSIVESVRSVCNDAGIGYDGGGYLFIPLNSGCLNNPVSISQFASGSKWFGMWDNVGLSSVVPATSVTLSSGVVTITFGTLNPFVAGYGLFYTEDGGTTWVQSTFHLA